MLSRSQGQGQHQGLDFQRQDQRLFSCPLTSLLNLTSCEKRHQLNQLLTVIISHLHLEVSRTSHTHACGSHRFRPRRCTAGVSILRSARTALIYGLYSCTHINQSITQKVNCCISTTWEFPAGSLTCMHYLVSLLMLTRTQASRPRPGLTTPVLSLRTTKGQGPRPRTTSLLKYNVVSTGFVKSSLS